MAVFLGMIVIFVAAAVVAGRRFGVRALWAMWIVGSVASNLYPIMLRGGLGDRFSLVSAIVYSLMHALPMGIGAWVIAITLRGPRPAGFLVQVTLGTLAYLLTFLVQTVVIVVVWAEL
jgi:hypothetical protein